MEPYKASTVRRGDPMRGHVSDTWFARWIQPLLTICLALAFCAESRALSANGPASAGALVSLCCVVQDDGQPTPRAPGAGEPDIDNKALEEQLPDPELDRQRGVEAIELARQEGDDNKVALVTRVLERVETIRRADEVFQRSTDRAALDS